MQVEISTKSHINCRVQLAGSTSGKYFKDTKQSTMPSSLNQKNNIPIVTTSSNWMLIFNNRFNDNCIPITWLDSSVKALI